MQCLQLSLMYPSSVLLEKTQAAMIFQDGRTVLRVVSVLYRRSNQYYALCVRSKVLQSRGLIACSAPVASV